MVLCLRCPSFSFSLSQSWESHSVVQKLPYIFPLPKSRCLFPAFLNERKKYFHLHSTSNNPYDDAGVIYVVQLSGRVQIFVGFCGGSDGKESTYCLYEFACSKYPEVESDSICPFVEKGLFNWAYCFQGSSTLNHVSGLHPFLRLSHTPSYGQTTFCFSVRLPMETWVASTFWLLWTTLLWTWMCKYLSEFLLSSPLGICLRPGLLGHMITLC